jgi:DNA recombination protein RmuC
MSSLVAIVIFVAGGALGFAIAWRFLPARFENLANRIFEEKNSQSKQHLQDVLAPLKEDLTGFKKHINESFGNHAKEQFALKKEIENIVKVSREMTVQTEGLSKALKGDSKAQGNWGEVALERILEASGLKKGEDYLVQGGAMGLKHAEDGRVQKPDFIVRLPEGKHIIIDSKVSLTAYERLCSEQQETQKATHLSQFLNSVKAHAKGLEERRYQDADKLGTPDFVLMFMPIEGAYSLAVQQDPDLHAYAWERKIVIVCPSTLFATLRTIASVWRMERQNQNTQEIARRGGLLYDKVARFAEDMLKLGKQIGLTQSTYEEVMGKLRDAPGNILRQSEQLKEMGVKASKNIPQELLADQDEAA